MTLISVAYYFGISTDSISSGGVSLLLNHSGPMGHNRFTATRAMSDLSMVGQQDFLTEAVTPTAWRYQLSDLCNSVLDKWLPLFVRPTDPEQRNL